MNLNLSCPICAGNCSLLDVVDFNKSCEEAKGKFLPQAGIPVYYTRCDTCGFCFAPEIAAWDPDEFEKKIYNDEYVIVDPDYVELRPRSNAANLITMFGDRTPSIKHLDYGGGAGLLAKLLRESNWQSSSYDPFVDRNTHIEQLGQFDLITAFEVFEHVPNVLELMSNLRTLLAPNGLVLFSTLLSDGQINPNQRINWWYASPRNGHISLFSRKSLAILAQQNGLNFGSFSNGMHVFFTKIPPWAAHLEKLITIHTPPQQSEQQAITQPLQQAIALHQAGQLQEAGEIYMAILQTQPNHPEANYNLAMIAVQANQPAASLPYFTAALDADPSRGQFWLSYVDALFRAGQQEDARQILALARQQGLEGNEVDALAQRLEGHPQPAINPPIPSSKASFPSGDIEKSTLAVAPPYQLVQARHGWMLANPNDFYLGRAIIEYGECIEIESLFLIRLLAFRPGKVIEVGANMGAHTIPLAKALAPENREIVAFEPQPFIFQNMCANLALNGITNATAWPWACGAQSEIVHFSKPDYTAQGNFGGISMATEARHGSVAVPCVRLDDVIGSDPVSLMKIDVEGYELLTLQGAVGILTGSRPLLYVENDRPENSQALIEWLWSQNYQLFWHIPNLFNPDNFFSKKDNIYGNVASFNMLGIPKELKIAVDGLHEITSSTNHPLTK